MAVRVLIHYVKGLGNGTTEQLPTPKDYPDRIDFPDASLGQIDDRFAMGALMADVTDHNPPPLPEGVTVAFEYIDPNRQMN